jgi:hypothetical protein
MINLPKAGKISHRPCDDICAYLLVYLTALYQLYYQLQCIEEVDECER